MKIFFAALTAILVAAGTFYLIHQQNEKTAAHAAIDAEMRDTQNLLPGYGARPSPSPIASPLPSDFSGTMVAKLELKLQTIDGPVIIPKGTVLKILPEKSKPGTVMINYEGYTLTIPSTSITEKTD